MHTTQLIEDLPWQLPAALLLVIVFVLLYFLALPKPLSGIPYHKVSAGRVLGDVPNAISWQRKTGGEVMSYLTEQCRLLESPMVQLFLRPFDKPTLVIADFRESQDILARRTKEFDRSARFGELFDTLVPKHHIHMATNDTFRAHRRLIGDTMSSQFLHKAAALIVYQRAMDLINLWREKARLAQHHPFKCSLDITKATLDIIWEITFGSEVGTTMTQTEFLHALDKMPLPANPETEIAFPQAQDPDTFTAIMKLGDMIELGNTALFPRTLQQLALRFSKSYSSAAKLKDHLLKTRIEESAQKIAASDDSENEIKSALDLILQREAAMAEKSGRAPENDTDVIRDELLGFLVAGHETTATTLSWAMKLLTDNPKVQRELRDHLWTHFKDARLEGRAPSMDEIVHANVPYLQATIEECHRCGLTAPGTSRVTTVDTEILGYSVPKGCDVFVMANGPSFLEPSLDIDESRRSESSRMSKNKNGTWDASNMSQFEPQRWLTQDETGTTVFDPRAGPDLPFGAGPRGCFGRKLAELELKVILTLIIWHFELDQCPVALSSYRGIDRITHQPQQCYVNLREAI